jgi:Toprim domain-containing protein
MSDDHRRPSVRVPRDAKPTRIHEYTDAAGAVLFYKNRYDVDGEKTFRCWAKVPGGSGRVTWKLADMPRVLYRLHTLQRQEHAYVCEGESDVDAIARAGGIATTNPFGALEPWQPAYSVQLAQAGVKRVTIVADRDGPGHRIPYCGERRAERIATALTEAGFVVEVKQPATGKDARDHLIAGKTLADLAPFEPPPARVPQLVVTAFADVAEEVIAWLWPGVIPWAAGRPGSSTT